MIKYLPSDLICLHEESTYHDQRATSVAVEFKGHHVARFFHLTFAGRVIEVQDGVVDASLGQQTVSHVQRGGPLLADRWFP